MWLKARAAKLVCLVSIGAVLPEQQGVCRQTASLCEAANTLSYTLQNDGSVITVRAYLRQHFNFRYDLLGVAVAVLCGYIALYG